MMPALAAAAVMIAFASPLAWLWPLMMAAPYWLGFLILAGWFAVAVHFATMAAVSATADK